MSWNYGPDWYYEHPRNAYQDWHNRYYSYRRMGAPPPSALSRSDTNRWKYELSGVPIIGDFIRASDNTRRMNDYLRTTGLTWADVKYPSLAPGAGSTASAFGRAAETMGMTWALRRMYR